MQHSIIISETRGTVLQQHGEEAPQEAPICACPCAAYLQQGLASAPSCLGQEAHCTQLDSQRAMEGLECLAGQSRTTHLTRQALQLCGLSSSRTWVPSVALVQLMADTGAPL
jgi:hypothetical protein